MILYFWLGGIALAGLGMLGLLSAQISYLRRSEIVDRPAVSLTQLAQARIDRWYFAFAFFFRQARHYSYLYTLIAIRRGLLIFRYLLTRVERRFARLIDSVRGRQLLHSGAPVSLFLAQIKDHKESVVTKAGIAQR